MQLLLIFGIAFAIVSVLFALQNNIPVTVTFMVWHFDGSLALILLIALALGALAAGLMSSPALIKSRWQAATLGRKVADLEQQTAHASERISELEAELEVLRPPSSDADPQGTKPYVGLKALLAGNPPREP